MKAVLRSLAWPFLLLWFTSRLAAVTAVPFAEAVSVSCTVSNGATASMNVYGEETAPAFTYCNPAHPVADEVLAYLRPGKRYTVNFGVSTGSACVYTMSFTPPEGYFVYIDGIATNLLPVGDITAAGNYSRNHTLELRPVMNFEQAPAGAFSGIQIGKSVSWDVGLGGLKPGGLSAGRLTFKQMAIGASCGQRSSLFYGSIPNSGEIWIYTDPSSSGQVLRQVGTPQTVVDLVDDGTSAYWIRFYEPSQATWNGSMYSAFSGSPWKTIRVEYNSSVKQLMISETEGSVTRVSVLTAPDGGVGTGAYSCTLQEGDGTTWLRTTVHTSTVGSGYRDDVVVVRTGGVSGTVVAKTKYRYEPTFGSGDNNEALVRIVTDPDGSALETIYDYHVTSTEKGNYRRVKSVTQPTGSWVSYLYYDDWDRRGQLKTEYRPYLDSAISALASGQVTTYDYQADWTGRHTRLTLREERIGGVLTGKSTYTNGDIVGFGPSRETTAVVSYSGASATRTDYNEVYREDSPYDVAHRTYFVRGADGTHTGYGYAGGTYNTTTNVFTVTGGDYHYRILTVRGLPEDGSIGDYVSSFQGQSFYPVRLIANKSTVEAVIYDRRGLAVRSESWVHTGGTNFSRLTHSDFTYDGAGRLTQSVDQNGATVTHTYTGGRLVKTVDATGIETEFTYDHLGRLATSVKKGAAALAAVLTAGYSYPAQSDLTTTFTYDGADRITQQVVSGGSLSQTTTRVFDLSGRQTQQTDPGAYTTTYAYSSGGKVVTTTLPSGATQVTETYPDGQLMQVSGTGVVSQYNSYWIDSASGRRARQQIIGGFAAAWTNTGWDWLGRVSEEWIPGWNGNATAKFWHYNTAGQLARFSQAGVADTLYVYDALGVRVREGLDVNANGTLDLASDDRISETAYSLFVDGSARATRQTISRTYATSGSATPTTTSTATTLLSGLGAGVQASSSIQDILGNVSTSILTVDRANKKVTATTDTPDSSVDAVSISYNGLAVESRDTAALVTRTEFDTLGRAYKSIDPRIGATVTTFVTGTNQVSSVTDPAGLVQATYTYDAAGRVSTVTDVLGKVARYAYTDRGEKYREWGDTPYPVEYGYDTAGRQTTMKTFRGSTTWNGASWPSSPGTADTTTWNFHAATGLLSSKTDADNQSVTYTYTQARQLATRTWARGTTTTYAYSPTTGEQSSIDYADSTPDLTYTYDRLGKVKTVGDYTGTRTFNYSPTTLLTTDETLPSAFYGSRLITWKHDTTTTGALGRNTGFSLGLTSAPTGENDIAYGYDTYGRFTTLEANLKATAAGNFAYGYTAQSQLIGSLTETGSGLLQARTYLADRNLVSQFATTLPSRNLATYAYTHDNLGRRTVKIETGEMFSRYGPGLVTRYGYNDRSEVISAATYLGTTADVATTAPGNALPGRSYAYAYDPIGNRTTTTTNGQASTYTTNSLNQIVSRTTPPVADVTGLAASNATVTVAGEPTARRFDYFHRQHPLDNSTAPVWANLTVNAAVAGGASASENRLFYLARSLEQFSYDLDGNLLSDGRWDYVWDAENRLVAMTTTSAAATAGIPSQALQFRYDYLGRRVEKKVYPGGAPTPATHLKFVYSSTNWHLLAEYDALAGNALVRSYAWGLDLSRSTTGAGGVGGLLAVQDTSTAAIYHPTYDANGNVFAVLEKATGAIAASYEYNAFGETLRASGTFAGKNLFRFSTKYTDTETQLLYYGHRYYNSSLGRFVGRDPISEKGGFNLYGFVGNNPINKWDYIGLTPPEGYYDESGNYHFSDENGNEWTYVGYESPQTEGYGDPWSWGGGETTSWDRDTFTTEVKGRTSSGRNFTTTTDQLQAGGQYAGLMQNTMLAGLYGSISSGGSSFYGSTETAPDQAATDVSVNINGGTAGFTAQEQANLGKTTNVDIRPLDILGDDAPFQSSYSGYSAADIAEVAASQRRFDDVQARLDRNFGTLVHADDLSAFNGLSGAAVLLEIYADVVTSSVATSSMVKIVSRVARVGKLSQAAKSSVNAYEGVSSHELSKLTSKAAKDWVKGVSDVMPAKQELLRLREIARRAVEAGKQSTTNPVQSQRLQKIQEALKNLEGGN